MTRIHTQHLNRTNDTETLYILQTTSTIQFGKTEIFGIFGCLGCKNHSVTPKLPMSLRFCALDFSQVQMFETKYNIFKRTLEDLYLHNMDFDSVFLHF